VKETRTLLEQIVVAVTIDPSWLDIDDVQAALDLIVETALVDPAEIRVLFEGDEEWLDRLAWWLARREIPADVDPRLEQTENSVARTIQDGGDPPPPPSDSSPFVPSNRSAAPPALLSPSRAGDGKTDPDHDLLQVWAEMDFTKASDIRFLIEHGVGWSRAKGLLNRGLTQRQVTQIAHGGDDYAGIEGWLNAGYTFDEVRPWIVEGFAPKQAAKWRTATLETPEKAREWSENGFSLSDVGAWTTMGFVSPRAARRWRSAGFNPDVARAWRDGGISPATARDWLAGGCENPASMKLWLDSGVSDPSAMRQWSSLGIAATEAGKWRALQVSADGAGRFGRSGVSIADVEQWTSRTHLAASELRMWVADDVKASDATEWHLAGVTNSGLIRAFREGATPAEFRDLRECGFTVSESHELLAVTADPEDIRVLILGISPADLLLIRELDVPTSDLTRWMRMCQNASEIVAWQQTRLGIDEFEQIVQEEGLKPSNLKQWLQHGFDAREMVLAHRSGCRSPRVWETERQSARFQAGDSAHGSATEFAIWVADGRAWFKHADVDPVDHERLLRLLHEEGLEWSDPSEDLFEVPMPDEWLDEMQDRAMFLANSMTKEPRWPCVFESAEVTIVVDGSGDWALAWVGVEGRGGLVCFDMVDFNIFTAKGNASWRYAAGVALAWFLDCCLILRSDRRNKPFGRESSRATGSGFERAAGRYVPRMSFSEHYRTVLEGHRISPRPHWVDGFVRTFQQGQQPTYEARDRAPARIRRTLRHNQTWVSGFRKGGHEQLEELRVYLTKYSALADAMALADSTLRDVGR
jgi:hypothetical protein